MLYFKNLSFLKTVVVNLQHRTVSLKASLLIRHSIIWWWVAVILFAGSSFYSLQYIINNILILITLIIICSARKSQVRRGPTGCLYQRKISVCNYWRKCLCTWRSCIHLQLDSREKYLLCKRSYFILFGISKNRFDDCSKAFKATGTTKFVFEINYSQWNDHVHKFTFEDNNDIYILVSNGEGNSSIFLTS